MTFMLVAIIADHSYVATTCMHLASQVSFHVGNFVLSAMVKGKPKSGPPPLLTM